jgi:hypothetical protein
MKKQRTLTGNPWGTFVLSSRHIPQEEHMVQAQEIIPEAFSIEKAISTDWNYQVSIMKVKSLYISWKTVSTDLLQELWIAKQAITLNGARMSGRPKKGDLSWSAYVKDCFDGAISKRSIDNYLARYEGSGMIKPIAPAILNDHSKLEVRNIRREGDRVTFEIYLPEFNVSYPQAFAA